jgi:hypothetical protein
MSMRRQQVKLLEELIAQTVDVTGLVPIDVKGTEPVLKRAQEAGIPVITPSGKRSPHRPRCCGAASSANAIADGVEIPGLGKAVVDVDNKQIKVEKIMIVNRDTVDGLIKQGL